jgi:hypothetical protein
MSGDRGSTIPLVLGFFLVALLAVAGAVALGDAFVKQRGLQDVCDGAAAAAAASAADLDRGRGLDDSLRFADAARVVAGYLGRDPLRRSVHVTAALSPDRERITLTCEETTGLAFGALFGHPRLHHVATSSARAAVLGTGR